MVRGGVADLGNENWRLHGALAQADRAIAGAGANAVTAREWAHDMDVVQHIARKALDPNRLDEHCCLTPASGGRSRPFEATVRHQLAEHRQ